MMPMQTFRYSKLAGELENQIMDGVFRAGEKMPSLRRLHTRTGLSISTVYQAYIELEKRGMIEARPRSGYYVRPQLKEILPPPVLQKYRAVPRKVTTTTLAHSIVESMSDNSFLQLGGTSLDPALLPCRQLAKIIKSATTRDIVNATAKYEDPYGNPALKKQIARTMVNQSGETPLDEIVVTNGCIEAVSLCLQAVAAAGDTIIVESPTYPWFLQVIEDLKMYALELPTDPRTGIDPEILGQAMNRKDVRACLLIPTFHNPLGFSMPRNHKKAILETALRRNIPIIEDDIHGELYFGRSRPTSLKSMDTNGNVLYCSSFSKNLAPGLRVGWTLPGRFTNRVKRLKLNLTIASSTFSQYAVCAYLKTGAWDRHLRKLRTALKNQVSNTALAIARHFPDDTRITAPQGGMVLWVQLGSGVDGMAVFHQAYKQRISILPGSICSTTGKYSDAIRISCGFPWNERIEKGIVSLAWIVRKLRVN